MEHANMKRHPGRLLSNYPSPNGLSARNLRRLKKKKKQPDIIYNPSSASVIPSDMTYMLEEY